MSEQFGNHQDRSILPNGGEVEIEGFDDVRVYDRIEFHGRFVHCINKQGYQLDVWPADRVRGINTYTKHLEDEGWW
ncbi:hypothetical protein G9C85_02515 [Halorubellus sp. JP-L1]|uniref:hypothetical protein n=1 Tax=Halorubellus sp. JP-L1 TaxID=2715753 RepID=UPI00140AF43F|nr:hypothetical protein [Halorubellus sp. JP-L1]NHN40511.1 hypothetical protein [Halorubellus sp. JP-L1]